MKHWLRSHFFLFLSVFLAGPIGTQAQVLTRRSATGVTVDKSGLGSVDSNIPLLTLPAVNTAPLLQEDEFATKMGHPFRFGTSLSADIHITQAARVAEKNGYRVFQYKILAPGAFSINLIFDHFRLASGARLYLYDPNRTTVIGPITDQQNPETGQFWTDIMPGNQLIIELQEPSASSATSVLHLSNVIHGYKNLFSSQSQDKAFAGSGSCELNMACYPDLQTQADGVVMILLDQATRLCTGSMVNNTQQNFRSFLLTAFHCIDIGTVVNNVRTGNNDGVLSSSEIAQAQNWLIRFNYQSPTCTPSQDDNEYVTLNGSALLASYNQSDFALLEIYQQVPTDANTTYLGWSTADAGTSNAFVIHHPSGDVKKVSFTNADTQISGYGTTSGTDHLTAFWGSLGVTETGSSGSPLFDANRRIIGQLHGGPSYCGATGVNLRDYFGRFFTSWTGGGTTTSRLSTWLDPINSNSQTTNNVKPAVNGPASFTNTGTFSVNVGDAGIVSWSITGAVGSVFPTSGGGNTASLTALSANTSLTITFTVNGGQPYPIRFTKTFIATVPTPAPPVGGISSQTATAGNSFNMSIPAFIDTRALTYSTSSLPSGLSFNTTTRTISGIPSKSGVYSITITATNTAELSSWSSFQLTVLAPGPLMLLEPNYNCTTRQLILGTTGGNGSSIQFMAVGVTGWTTASSFTLDAGMVNDPNAQPLTIYVRQDNTTLSRTFNYRLACINKSPNQAPIPPTITNQWTIMGQSFNFTVPAFTDDQPLTYTVTGLPAGLSFNASTRLISGDPFITGVSAITITATDTESASANATFFIVVYPAGSLLAPLTLSIPTYNCTTGALTFNTTGGDGTTIEYMAVGVTGWTINPNQVVEAGVRNDPNAGSLLLRARQSGNVVSLEFNPRQACLNAGQNYAPIAPVISNQIALLGQSFSFTIPAFSDNQPLSYIIGGIPPGLSYNFQQRVLSGIPTFTGNFTVTITAVDPGGLFTSTTFLVQVFTATPNTISLLDPLYNCSTRQLTFRTSGGDGTTIQYMAVGVTGWTTNPVQFIEEAVVADANNRTIQLNARQGNVTVSRIFNFRQACSAARESIPSGIPLTILVQGNPTASEFIDAEIQGAYDKPISVRVTDTQGILHSEQTIERAIANQPVHMRLGKASGIYLLEVTSQGQRQAARILKIN